MARRRRLEICCASLGLVIAVFGINGCSLLPLYQNHTLKQKKLETQRQLNEWYHHESPFYCEEGFKDQLRFPNLYRRFQDFISIRDDGTEKVLAWSYIVGDGNIYAAGCIVSRDRSSGRIIEISKPYFSCVTMLYAPNLGCVDSRSKKIVKISMPR